jgi:hypothetical protein
MNLPVLKLPCYNPPPNNTQAESLPPPQTTERKVIGKGGSNFVCVCWRVMLPEVLPAEVLHLSSFIKNFVLVFLLKSVIIIYDLSLFRISICVQSTQALEISFFQFQYVLPVGFFWKISNLYSILSKLDFKSASFDG